MPEAAPLIAHRSRAQLGCHIRDHSGIHRRAGSRPCARAAHCTVDRSVSSGPMPTDRVRSCGARARQPRGAWMRPTTRRATTTTQKMHAQRYSVVQRPRGMAEGESSDSDDSLEEQEFAGMEELMAQLDEAEPPGDWWPGRHVAGPGRARRGPGPRPFRSIIHEKFTYYEMLCIDNAFHYICQSYFTRISAVEARRMWTTGCRRRAAHGAAAPVRSTSAGACVEVRLGPRPLDARAHKSLA